MALPKIKQPLFDITIPSTDKKVMFRPFTVKEEKILLIAQESKELDQIITAIKQIINNCIEDVNVEKLAMFDLEYLLIHLRSKSVGDEVNFQIKDPSTEETVELSIDLNDIEIKKDENHKLVIPMTDEVSLKMRYPNLEQVKKLGNIFEKASDENKMDNEALFSVMIDCIESIVEGEDVYLTKDTTEEEINVFVESLSAKNIEDIKQFFETIPKLRYETTYKTSDGKERKFVAEGTETFFI